MSNKTEVQKLIEKSAAATAEKQQQATADKEKRDRQLADEKQARDTRLLEAREKRDKEKHESNMAEIRERQQGKAKPGAGRSGSLTQKQEIDILHRHEQEVAKEYEAVRNKEAKDIPENLRTPESRRQLAEDRGERDIMPFRVDPELQGQFNQFAKQLPRMQADPANPKKESPVDFSKMSMEQLIDFHGWMSATHKIKMPRRVAFKAQAEAFKEIKRRTEGQPPEAELPTPPNPTVSPGGLLPQSVMPIDYQLGPMT